MGTGNKFKDVMANTYRAGIFDILSKFPNGATFGEIKEQYTGPALHYHLYALYSCKKIIAQKINRTHKKYFTPENYYKFVKNGKNIADNSQAKCSRDENSGAKRSGIEDCLEC
jgi:hypothetical protein